MNVKQNLTNLSISYYCYLSKDIKDVFSSLNKVVQTVTPDYYYAMCGVIYKRLKKLCNFTNYQLILLTSKVTTNSIPVFKAFKSLLIIVF